MSAIDRRLRGAKGGGKGGGKAKKSVTAADTLFSNSIARLFDIVSEGEIGGLYTNDLRSVFVVDGTTFTPVQNEDGSFNFDGITVTEVFGTPDQGYISGFPAVEYETVVNAQVTTSSPVVRTISDLDLDAIRLKVRWPRIAFVDAKGNVTGSSMDIAIDLQPDGGSYSEVVRDTFSGKCESPYEAEYRIDLPAGQGPWTIRVRRNSPDSAGLRQSDSFWSSFTGVIDAKLKYPHTAGYFIKVDAQQFGETSIPGRAYLIKGIKIEVPTNYDPVTRVYATEGPGTTGGIWDGTFKREVCGNPAWVFRDLAINKRYGAGDEVDQSQVDKWTLYEIAQYCDGMLDDGKGGLIPRYEINTQINSQEQAYALLQAIASAFRGFPYWGAGDLPLTAGQDRPQDPQKQFSSANVIGGTFNREGVDILAQHSVALVTWNDPEDGYRTAVEQVIDRDLVRKLGWRPIQVAAFGCTDQSRAHRFGRWILDTEQNEQETISFSVGLADADVAPGEVVQVTDSMVAGVRYGGGIVSVTATSLTIDQSVDLIPGEEYSLTVVLPDGTLSADIPLTNAAGSATVLTWSAPLATLPQPNAIWVISAPAVEPELFRVLKIVETEKHIFEITGLKHDSTKYARIEQNLTLDPPNVSILPTGPIRVPLNLAASGYLFNPGPNAQVAATLSWTPPSDPRVQRYELQAALPDEAGFSIFPEPLSGVTYTIPNAGAGEITFRVRSLDALGRKSAWATFTGTIRPLSDRPETVANFRVTALGDVATLKWDIVDFDIEYYWIRFSTATSGASWEAAVDLEPQAFGNSAAVPSMIGTYLIKAVDFLGNESQVAASAINLSGGLTFFNVEETLQESPDFDGAMTDVVYDGGLSGIVLDTGATSGTYNFFNSIDLTEVYTSKLRLQIEAGGINTGDDFFAADDIFSLEDWFQAGSDSWSVEVQVRTTPDDPSGSPVWTNWEPLFVGDFTFRAAEFRVILRSFAEEITPLVTSLSITVDMPDRSISAKDVAVPDTGLSITYTPKFKAFKVLSITLLDGATGDYFDVSAQDETGFTLFIRDSSAAAISGRHVNWDAKGWGLAA